MFRWSPRPSRQEATVNRGRDCEPRPRGTRRERSEMQGAGVQKCAALRVCLLWRGLTAFLTKKNTTLSSLCLQSQVHPAND